MSTSIVSKISGIISSVSDLTSGNISVDTNGNVAISKRLKPSSNTESLSGSKTLVTTSPQYQFLNPNGSNRDVNLPAAETDMLFTIVNTGSAGNILTVKDSGGTAITNGAIANGITMGFYYNGTNWQIV